MDVNYSFKLFTFSLYFLSAVCRRFFEIIFVCSAYNHEHVLLKTSEKRYIFIKDKLALNTFLNGLKLTQLLPSLKTLTALS